MSHWQEQDDDDADDWGEDGGGGGEADGERLSAAELPDPADTDPPADDRDDLGTIPCPFCRRPVYEYADVCPRCRNFIGGADEPPHRRPLWVTIGLVLTLAAMLVTCVLRMW